jgi:thiamine-monophosphate kinase
MGATPRAALLSLALPGSLPLEDFDALIDGVVSLGERYDVPLVGGNLTRSPGPLVIDVTAIGSAHPRRVIRRDTARAGHELYVTGLIGAAAAGRAFLEAGRDRAELGDAAAACIERYERPEPRLRCGVQVARNRAASAGIDLSDGLGDAARQIAAASGTGVLIEAGRLPIHPEAAAWAATAGLDATAFALNGGDDYELLFAVAPRQRRAFLHATARCRGLAVTRIGRLTTEDGAWLERDGSREPLAHGFAHF